MIHSMIDPSLLQPVIGHFRYEKMSRQQHQDLVESVGEELTQRTVSMCRHVQDNLEAFTEDKTSRWLGFVQGVLTVAGVLNVEVERDYTRPLFHAIHGVGPSQSVASNQRKSP